MATADLEIEVMRLLSDAKADLGEQINVARTPEGLLRVQGVVETDQRKREILGALAPVSTNPAVKVEIRTVAEALAEQRRNSPNTSSAPVIVEQVQTASDIFPAYPDLRKRLTDEESRQFADRMVERSRRAMSHAGAMKKLAARFSAEDLRTLTPEARAKWLALIRNHARAFEQETKMLREELQPIFFPAPPSGESSGEILIAEDKDLVRVVERLFEVGLANEQIVRSAFAVSTERTASSAFKALQFWHSLREAESLAAKIASHQ